MDHPLGKSNYFGGDIHLSLLKTCTQKFFCCWTLKTHTMIHVNADVLEPKQGNYAYAQHMPVATLDVALWSKVLKPYLLSVEELLI